MFLTSLNFCCYYSEEWIYMNLRCLWSLCLLIHTYNKWDSGWKCSLLVRLLSSTAAAAKSLQSCLTLCDPIDGSPPGSPVPGILQARTMEWVVIFFSNARKWKVSELGRSSLTLSDPMDYSLPGSSVHGIFQQEYWSGVPLPSLCHPLASAKL